jgi:hypothetical protein
MAVDHIYITILLAIGKQECAYESFLSADFTLLHAQSDLKGYVDMGRMLST